MLARSARRIKAAWAYASAMAWSPAIWLGKQQSPRDLEGCLPVNELMWRAGMVRSAMMVALARRTVMPARSMNDEAILEQLDYDIAFEAAGVTLDRAIML